MASSSGRARLEGYLRQLGLLDDFEVIVCREDVEQIKPAPDLFLKALDTLKLQTDELLVFEDSQNGILAATRAGMRVVAVPTPSRRTTRMRGPACCLIPWQISRWRIC